MLPKMSQTELLQLERQFCLFIWTKTTTQSSIQHSIYRAVLTVRPYSTNGLVNA